MVNVLINGDAREAPSAATLDELIKSLGLNGAEHLAVAINDAVVPRSAYLNTIINDGDRIEIIQAVGGG